VSGTPCELYGATVVVMASISVVNSNVWEEEKARITICMCMVRPAYQPGKIVLNDVTALELVT